MRRWSRSRMVATALVMVAGFMALFLTAQVLLTPSATTSPADLSSPPSGAAAEPGTCSSSAGAPESRDDYSPMQRRLIAGDKLRWLLARLRNGDISETAAQWEFVVLGHALLSVEQDNSLRFKRLDLETALSDVVNRELDTATLRLQATDSSDSLGSDLLVRVWTPNAPIAHETIERATDLVRTLDRIANTDSIRGFDVLGEVDMARRRLRPGAFPTWAAGVFLWADDLCIVDTRGSASATEMTLKHELVHAWKHRHRGTWALRFVSEGLSEYLERARVTPQGLRVDLRPLRHNFRGLLARVDVWKNKDRIPIAPKLRRLVTCSPRVFYGLRWLTYPLAQAMFAFIGMDTVTEAIARNDENGLVDALSSIDWPDFYRFLQKHSAQGDAAKAWWVNEGPLDPYVTGGVTKAERINMFRAMGLGPERLRRARLDEAHGELSRADAQFRVGATIRDVPTLADVSNRSGLVQLGALLNNAAHVGRLGFVSEVSPKMRRGTTYRDPPVGLFAPAPDQMPRSVTGADVVGRYLAALQALAPSMPVTTYRSAIRVTEGALPFSSDGFGPSLASVGTWLVKGAGKADAVVMVLATSNTSAIAGLHEALVKRDAAWQHATKAQKLRGAALLLSEALSGASPRPAAVLLVDVSAGQSDAAAFAMALSMAWKGGTQVGYWDPAAE